MAFWSARLGRALCDLSSLVLILSPVKMVLIGKLISQGDLGNRWELPGGLAKCLESL